LNTSNSLLVKFNCDAVRMVASCFGYPQAVLSTSACPAFVEAICEENRPAAAKTAM
jgi:hypothetical protein